MPKILITGNGFDLNIGLPTLYSDFIRILNYIESNSVFDFQNVYSQTSNFLSINENFDSFEIASDEIIKLKTQLTHNLWFQFFKNEYQIETWIDFENKIEYVLSKIFSSIEILENGIFSGKGVHENSLRFDTSLFDQKIEIIQVLNSFKIIDFLNGHYILLNKDFLITKYGFNINIDVDKVTKYLFQQLLEFKLIFNYYFEIFISPLFNQIKIEIDKNYFRNINYHYTFNYTSTFESLYSQNITRHLHGKINSKENQIVLGINEIPINESNYKKEFISFTKYFQKLNNETDYVFIKELKYDSFENYVFFFWGHSLDKSDQDYINEVFDFINEAKSEIKKIVIVYHTNISKSKMLINLLDIRGSKDIQDLMRSKILSFVQIDSKELDSELKVDITRKFFI